MTEEKTEDLKQELREKEYKIKHLEEELRESMRNPYVNSDNILGSIFGGAFLASIPIFFLLHYLGVRNEGLRGFVAGVVGTGIGAYSYHHSVEKWQKAQQNKYWQQRDS